MKLLVLSDIHANYEALKVLLPYIKSSDKILCLGDIVGYGCAVNECIDIIRNYEFVCIQGNHDRYIIEGMENQTKILNDSVRFGINYAQKIITVTNLDWIKSLPVSLSFKIDNLSILMVHGSPFNPVNGYVYEDSTDFTTWNSFRYNYIFIGHTHRELTKNIGETVVINPGSVGQARDLEGKVCACILDTSSNTCERLHVDYDFRKHLNLSLSKGAGDWIYKHYRNV